MNSVQEANSGLSLLLTSSEEFDRVMVDALPELLDLATQHTKRFLKETGQWVNDTTHEKLALRWGYELVERFIVCGRAEVPCRPLFLLESQIAKYFSQPQPLCYHPDLLSPLGRFLDGLASRAVVSRDALMALFYHVYGVRQGQVVRLLGFGSAESQRVYKNFERWRQAGWQRTLEEVGLSENDLTEIEESKQRDPEAFNLEVRRLLRILQAHYRKSEPDHYPCLSRERWQEVFRQDFGHDYRVWHLAFCHECLAEVGRMRYDTVDSTRQIAIDLQIRPLHKTGVIGVLMGTRGGHGHHGTGRTSQRVSTTTA